MRTRYDTRRAQRRDSEDACCTDVGRSAPDWCTPRGSTPRSMRIQMHALRPQPVSPWAGRAERVQRVFKDKNNAGRQHAARPRIILR